MKDGDWMSYTRFDSIGLRVTMEIRKKVDMDSPQHTTSIATVLHTTTHTLFVSVYLQL